MTAGGDAREGRRDTGVIQVCHLFRYIDHKEEATIRKGVPGRESTRMPEAGQGFYIVFCFLCVSTADYSQLDTNIERTVTSIDRFELYLLFLDKHTRHVWVFLTKSKDLPVDTAKYFLQRFGRSDRKMGGTCEI
jgi:hypothetical protein